MIIVYRLMASIPDIIEALGGAKAISKQIGVPLTTVHSWKRAGSVPSWRHHLLIGMKTEDGHVVSPADLAQRPDRAA